MSRYFHTLRFLKVIQIYYLLWYRIRGSCQQLTGYRYKLAVSKKGHGVKLTHWIDKQSSYFKNTFTFLNQKRTIEMPIPWDEPGYGKLWTYNLNYMEYLLQPEVNKATVLGLIYDFIAGFSINKTGKEPYPISLRGINWIKFLSKHNIHEKEIDNCLYAQYLILLDNLEYHLMGNHLLENGFSLLYAAFYFKDLKMYNRAKKILRNELSEQILSDGGHFERSPMYHQLILDCLLDGLNLLNNNVIFDDQIMLQKLMLEKASLMLGWINGMSYSNGEIPLFNDSVRGVAPSTEQLMEYANRLEIPIKKVTFGDSGYRSVNTSVYEVRLDVGDIGPDYIPGHAHADTFSFELHLHGKPLIVDTSISTYEKNERRQLERGTAAHNTVQVNGKDSSDVWGGFRVAQRAHVIDLNEDDTRIQARHNGYKHLGIIHKRSFTWDENQLEISDRLIGKQVRKAVTRFHFHPNIQPIIIENTIIFEGGELTFIGANSISINEFQYALEFNKLISSKVIEVIFKDQLFSKFKFK